MSPSSLNARLKALWSDPAVVRKLFWRGIVLFALLAAVKLGILLSLQKHLFHAKLRLEATQMKSLDWVNFAAFECLVLATFFCLGRHAKALPVRTIRLLNLWFVVVGICFAFLSLSRMDKNYVYPLMTGRLAFHDVGSYLVVDCFFARPWLAAYFIGYPLLYWVLLRTRREWCSFFLLGGLAALYVGFNLCDPMDRRREFLVLNCFALGALLSQRQSSEPFNWKLQLVPISLVAATWWLFRGFSSSIAVPGTGLIIALTSTLVLFLPGWTCFRRSPCFPTLSHFLPFYALAFLLLSNQGYPLAPNYSQLLIYALSLPHYFLQEFLCAAVLVLLALAASRLAARTSVWVFDLAGLVLVATACLDYQAIRTLGVRLDWSLVTMADGFTMALRTVRPYAAQAALALLALAAVYAVAVRLATRRSSDPSTSLSGPARSALWHGAATVLLLSCLASQLTSSDKAEGFGLTHLAATSPLLHMSGAGRLEPERFKELATKLDLMKYFDRAETPRATTNYPNVFLIVLESTYNRYLSMFGAEDETQPLLKKYEDRMELFPNFYSNFPNSCNARFTVLSGLYGAKQYVSVTNPRIEARSILEILHERGYATSVYQSDPRDYTRFGDYVAHRGVDVYHDCDTMPGKEKFKAVSWGVEEAATMEAIKARFAEHAKKHERFLLTYFPVAPHMPFDTPSERFDKFPSGFETITHNYSGRYKNQLLYVDWILASLLDELSELQLLDDTLVVITNDHGEMVDEPGGKLGHGWSLKPHLCNTPLIIMDPRHKGRRVNYALGSQVDVLPTMLDILGINLPSGDLYEGASLYDAASNEGKTVYFNSHQQRAMIRNGRYIVEDPAQKQNNNCNETLVFTISHQGTKTIFQPAPESANIAAEMDDYERFQNSFIAHYSYYKALLAKGHQAGQPTIINAREQAPKGAVKARSN